MILLEMKEATLFGKPPHEAWSKHTHCRGEVYLSQGVTGEPERAEMDAFLCCNISLLSRLKQNH